MLEYDDLSPAQKRWVDLVELFFPDIQLRGKITYKEIQEVHEFLLKKRDEDKRFKCAMPLWVITNNALSRGVYQFPASDVSKAMTFDEKMEQFYLAELARFGIKPKRRSMS